MIYRDLPKDFYDLLERFPFILEEQAIRLFQNYEGAEYLPEMLDEAIRNQHIVRHTLYGRFAVISLAKDIRLSEWTVVRMIRSFWPVANMGGENIEFIVSSTTPPEYTVQMTPDDPEGDPETGLVYSFSYVDTAASAELAARFRPKPGDSFQPGNSNDTEDKIYEVAVVPTEEHGNAFLSALRSNGFHYFCFADPQKNYMTSYRKVSEGSV